jgi:hypothetical protein
VIAGAQLVMTGPVVHDIDRAQGQAELLASLTV